MAEKLTKKEAVRRALAELGKDAMPVAIQGWIKEKFGLEMTAGHVSTTKGELLRKPAGTTAPAAAPEPTAESAAQPSAASSAETPSKAAAVRQALAALGKNASRTDIQTWVKEKLGVEMTLDHISTSKAEALRKIKEKAKAARAAKKLAAPAPPAPAAAAPKPKAQPAANGKGSVLLTDLVLVKDLIKRIGADQLLILIAALTGR